jgi:hypothetical protein
MRAKKWFRTVQSAPIQLTDNSGIEVNVDDANKVPRGCDYGMSLITTIFFEPLLYIPVAHRQIAGVRCTGAITARAEYGGKRYAAR